MKIESIYAIQPISALMNSDLNNYRFSRKVEFKKEKIKREIEDFDKILKECIEEMEKNRKI